MGTPSASAITNSITWNREKAWEEKEQLFHAFFHSGRFGQRIIAREGL
jgi:hypothetical protein